ncbi:MAG: GTPase Era [Trueperella sp.]|nr:GTPase Era [Trueperella sp.]
MINDFPDGFRAGFVSVVGRPNAGKSTLVNAMVGTKIAITADQPETTRRAIRGIVHRDDGQLILVDTPGMHRPRTLLGERLNDMVGEALSDVDSVVLCMPADESAGPGDRYILETAKKTGVPIVAVLTKTDKVTRDEVGERIIEVSQMHEFAEIVPVSAVAGDQVSLLVDLLIERMPQSPPLYPKDTITDETEEELIAELIREAALVGVREELPHSIAVVVEEMMDRPRPEGDDRKPVRAINAHLFVERPSQKGIVIGKGGKRMKRVGTQARESIERLIGQPVYLDLHVKVAKEWQRDPKMLGRLGF